MIRPEQHLTLGSPAHRLEQLQQRLTATEAELADARQWIEQLLAEREELRAALVDMLVIADTLPGVFNQARIERARGLVGEK